MSRSVVGAAVAVILASGAAGVAIGRATASGGPSPPVLPGSAGTFAGLWEVHAHLLTIDSSGYGILDWRVYTSCAKGIRPPCDVMNGNEIVDGGHATLLLTAAGPASATGDILTTTDPTNVPLGAFSTRIDPVRDLLYSSLPLFAKYPLCGQKAEAMSVQQQQTMGINCGA